MAYSRPFLVFSTCLHHQHSSAALRGPGAGELKYEDCSGIKGTGRTAAGVPGSIVRQSCAVSGAGGTSAENGSLEQRLEEGERWGSPFPCVAVRPRGTAVGPAEEGRPASSRSAVDGWGWGCAPPGFLFLQEYMEFS